ncbi:hypothetical protein CQ046_02770 [Chryseobacterium sp. MYb7]|uniref:SMEK domain-containing protein n=1 Tax=Chryseobacterium culicis TaxID=680127 RepID=A0A2S9CZL9_CHRCI|nr:MULTISPECIES: SMEK domain-containing protein [Chryseobacterium]PRB06110.1 hypothetical protein CQ046_02770 [Chryseobacterium sp. MYb7]PRB85967.1 hypothetical protein CQ022_06875 [Chryseobacterium culicis]PRB91720.1 hypothetical protein CQ033_00545 [Chryseobacterium culicis]
MDNKEKYVKLITRRLTYLKTEVMILNALNLTDINIFAENFYRDLFNLIGYSFTNTNFESNNYAFIDLIDHVDKIAIQVTSQNDNVKIKEAIDGFYSKPENKDYKLKLMLISKDAKDYRTKFGHDFKHKDDVLDITRLLALINDISDLDQVKKIAEFLDKHIVPERNKTESNEVETIMALIGYLSNEDNLAVSERPGNVDPDFKIFNRFADHSKFLISLYSELCMLYQQPLAEARKEVDAVKAIKISTYLKYESDMVLTRENNDPRAALDQLADIFNNKLSVNGLTFDKQAIRFYLLDELINCNVFPN